MEYLYIAVVIAVISTVVKFIFNVNLNRLKEFSENKELDKLVSKYPSNMEICKYYLRKLKNEKVKVEELPQKEASMYLIVGNKIQIGAISKSYTRIQTIAHECLHSIQSKKILMFNFIFSNLFFIYFFAIIILRFIQFEFVVNNQLVFLSILVGFGMAYYAVRTFLENDAMIKARFLAKEYMDDVKISSNKEIEEIIQQYDKLNDEGIKAVNYSMFLVVSVVIVAFSLICFVR